MNFLNSGVETQKCFIITHQNLAQQRVDEVRELFHKHDFNCKNVNHGELGAIVQKESLIELSNCSTLVIYIFADCHNVHGFKLSDNKEYLLVDLVRNFLIETISTRVFIIVNDTSGTGITKSFFNQTQICNVHFSYAICSEIKATANSNFLMKFVREKKNQIMEFIGWMPKICDITTSNSKVLNEIPEKELDQFAKTIFRLSANKLLANDENSVESSKDAFHCSNDSKDVCLILRFDPQQEHLTARKDIEQDVNFLEQTFGHLGFGKIQSYRNLKMEEVQNLFNKVVLTKFSKQNCFVLCIVAHFDNEWLYMQEEIIDFKNLLVNLIDTSIWLMKLVKHPCSLESIPKILILHDPYENKRVKIDVAHLICPEIYCTIPDLLLFQSCHKQSVSLENVNQEKTSLKGCLVIETLFQNVQKYSTKYDLCTILQIVASISSYETISMVNNVHLKSTLKRLLYFHNKRENEAVDPIREFTLRSHSNKNLYLKEKFLLLKKEQSFYQMSNKICLLFNFASSQVTESEISSLKNVFLQMNFTVPNSNLKDIELENQLDKCDCLILFLFVDGIENSKAKTNIEKLAELFANNKKLANKPKLLFIHGYRPPLYRDNIQTDSHGGRRKKKTLYIPKYADFMLFYTIHVSSSVKLLCQVFNDRTNRLDLMAQLNMVCQLMINDADHLEMPYINSTLTRLMVLNDEASNKESQLDNFKVARTIAWKNRGVCVIFNYESYPSVFGWDRTGTNEDEKILRSTFTKLNFAVEETHKDLSKVKTLKKLNEISNKDYGDIQCFVLCFLTHGFEDGTLACKNFSRNQEDLVNPAGIIHRNDLVDCLNKNVHLDKKPKLIIIQACHGNNKNIPVTVADCSSNNSPFKPASPYEPKFPDHQDLFVFAATYPGFESLRNQSEGTWFIQTLCRFILRYGKHHDLASIAAKVNQFVSSEMEYTEKYKIKGKKGSKIIEIKGKQIPCLYTTMAQPIKFEHHFE